jgi:DNA-binding transcriptional LysR family regulator
MSLALRHLRCFVAVAEELHFNRAAERLHIAQPALSVNIKRLEEELGVTLLRRSTRSVQLTEAGAIFLEKAKAAIAAFDEAVDLGGDLARGERGTLRVGGSSQVRHRLSNALSTFCHRHPQVEVIKREEGTGQLLADVVDRQIDVGLGLEPEHKPAISYRTVAREPLVLVLRDDHPLARREYAALTDLTDEVLLLPSERRARGYNLRLIARCAAAGFTPKVAEGVTDHDERFQSVLEGIGVELKCFDFVAERTSPGIAFVPIVPEETMSIELFWRTDAEHPLIELFIDVTMEEAAAPGLFQATPKSARALLASSG